MARQKKPRTGDASNAQVGPATTSVTTPPAEPPAHIDGPPVQEDGTMVAGDETAQKEWGNPYRAFISTATFEMGEDRRFKQRVFKFREKPADDVITKLKENGFTYRANEKAWTIPANAETRVLSERLASEFAGYSIGR